MVAAIMSISTGANAVNRTVVANGKQQKIWHFTAVNADCTSAGLSTVRIAGSPQYGAIAIRKVNDYPGFPPSSQRYRCNVKRFPSIGVFYTPARGFVGTDYVKIDEITPWAVGRTLDLTIDVH
ncbi:MAG: hypothetical protein ACREDJ_00225 [Methylocella sp.]